MNLSSCIVRVVEVVDTREWIEGPDDRWVAIPGSGQSRECDRCGRMHEVHAIVELDDGTGAVVGTGCMKGSDMAVAKALRSAERAAKKTRREAFERRKVQALVFAYEAALCEVEALSLPPVTEAVEHRDYGDVLVFRMGDAEVWYQGRCIMPDDRRERERALVQDWRRRRLTERGIGYAHRMAQRELDQHRLRNHQ